jgi:8-hydroxy-5-deazaflavin:NADPH oxidoreductase
MVEIESIHYGLIKVNFNPQNSAHQVLEPLNFIKQDTIMKFAVLGTGIVGQTIGSKLTSLGHEVKMGGREAINSKAQEWVAGAGALASYGTFQAAASFGEIVVNATAGGVSLQALQAAGAQALAGKVLIDIANPLDFSQGMPPTLSVVNTDSLGEQIQRAYPQTKVVKTLNTLSSKLMVNPDAVAGGDHNLFISGNDAPAKAQVLDLLAQFGWDKARVIDLGDISTARGTEQLLPIWIRLWGALGTDLFNFRIVRGA